MAALDGLKLPQEVPPAFVLYLATGTDDEPGKVYQVDEHGRVLGWVTVPSKPTGIALHREHGLVIAMPRDGGSIARIDDTGKLETILQKDKTVVHPLDVGIAGDSDSVVIADSIADVLATTTAGGGAAQSYRKFEGLKWTAQDMSVAVTRDKHVLLGTDGDKGIYRYSGDSSSTKPILPGAGAVAADPKTLHWAATQDSNQIYVFEGEELVKKLRLPPNKSHYRNGLLSFSPAQSLCVVARPSDDTAGEPWLFMMDYETEKVRALFPWQKEPINDFVVGPRMLWNRRSPVEYKSLY